MVQVVQQTKEEKIAMYMKCTKKQLAEMLWAANVLLDMNSSNEGPGQSIESFGTYVITTSATQ